MRASILAAASGSARAQEGELVLALQHDPVRIGLRGQREAGLLGEFPGGAAGEIHAVAAQSSGSGVPQGK